MPPVNVGLLDGSLHGASMMAAIQMRLILNTLFHGRIRCWVMKKNPSSTLLNSMK